MQPWIASKSSFYYKISFYHYCLALPSTISSTFKQSQKLIHDHEHFPISCQSNWGKEVHPENTKPVVGSPGRATANRWLMLQEELPKLQFSQKQVGDLLRFLVAPMLLSASPLQTLALFLLQHTVHGMLWIVPRPFPTTSFWRSV